jgi:hypothetical protein
MPLSQGTALQQSEPWLHCCPYSPHTEAPPLPPELVPAPELVPPPLPGLPPEPLPPPVLPHVPTIVPGPSKHSVPVQQSPLIVQDPPAFEQVEPVMQRSAP